MKRTLVILAVWAWMSASAGGVLAAKEKPHRTKPVPQPYTWMVRELALVDDQQDKIADILKPANVEKTTLDLLKIQNDAVVNLEKALGEARKKKDNLLVRETTPLLATAKADLKAARETIKPKLHDKIEADIMNVLTADQKTKWVLHAAVPEVLNNLKPVVLTPDQTGKVRTLCEEASMTLLAAWGSEKAEEWKAVIQGVVGTAKTDILSDAQQKQLPTAATAPAPKARGGK